jgi:hypothetical protein
MTRILGVIVGLFLAMVVKVLIQSKTDKEFDVPKEKEVKDEILLDTKEEIISDNKDLVQNNIEEFKLEPNRLIYIIYVGIGVVLFFVFSSFDKVLLGFITLLSSILITYLIDKSSRFDVYNNIVIYPDKMVLTKTGNPEKEIILFNSIGKVNIQSNFKEISNSFIRKEIELFDKNGEIITTILYTNFENSNYLKDLIFEKLNVNES